MARTEKNTVKTGKNGNGNGNGKHAEPETAKPEAKQEKLKDLGNAGSSLIPMDDIKVDWNQNVSRTFLNPDHMKESLAREFASEAFLSLKATIKSQGLLVPVLVTANDTVAKDGKPYRLVAGFRRYEACKQLNFTRIAAVVKQADERLLDAMNIIENIEREDITPFQRAKVAVDQMTKHAMSATDVAKLMGKTDTYIANLVRSFKNLHPDILRAWADRGLENRNGEPLNPAQFRATTTDRLNTYASIADKNEQLRQFRRNVLLAMGKSEEEADTLLKSEGFAFPTDGKGAKTGAKGAAKRPSVDALKKAIAAIEKDGDMDEENQACFVAALKFAAGIKATISVLSDTYYDPRKEEKAAKA